MKKKLKYFVDLTKYIKEQIKIIREADDVDYDKFLKDYENKDYEL